MRRIMARSGRARKEEGITPHTAQIDTMAAEFPADTNYLYTSYHAHHSDVSPSWRKKVLVLGSGPYRIGSSVEFDWCCVSAVQAASDAGYETIMLNYNPETVSTDYDICDKLYFEEISFESVMDLWEKEQAGRCHRRHGGPDSKQPRIPSCTRRASRFSGRAPKTSIAPRIATSSVHCWTSSGSTSLCWMSMTDAGDAESVVDRLGGFPVLVRPSYVLSGAAMSVAHQPQELSRILSRAANDQPGLSGGGLEVRGPRPRDRDRRSRRPRRDRLVGRQRAHRRRRRAQRRCDPRTPPSDALHPHDPAESAALPPRSQRELKITGPFNMQFLAKLGAVKVIECNLACFA